MRDENEAKRQRLQLAFAGWLPAADDDDAPTSDDWYTPPELVAELDDWLGGIDLDPCWSPRSFVHPRIAYSESRAPCTSDVDRSAMAIMWSADGLEHAWHGRVHDVDVRTRYVNPPYSHPATWIRRLDELHRELAPELVGDSLALVRIDTSTLWWQLAWRAGAIAWLRFRVPFVRPGRAVRSQPRDHHALIYWGPRVDAFCESFDWLAHCTRPREESAEQMAARLVELGYLRIDAHGQLALGPHSFAEEDAASARVHERSAGHKLVAIDSVPIESYPFLATDGPTGSSQDDLNPWLHASVADPDADTAVDEPIVDLKRPSDLCDHCGHPREVHGIGELTTECDRCSCSAFLERERVSPVVGEILFECTCRRILRAGQPDEVTWNPDCPAHRVTPTVFCICPAPGCPKHDKGANR